jgi:hypothetical protein
MKRRNWSVPLLAVKELENDPVGVDLESTLAICIDLL